jgi:heme/copper-type cytochrome/quinol oxidase subunit 3
MLGKISLRVASGFGLLVSTACVVAQTTFMNQRTNELYFWTGLVALFGYLFLTSRSREESDVPWWW